MAEQRMKTGMIAVGATLAVAIVKGAGLLFGSAGAIAKPAVQFGDEAAKAAIHASPVVDDVARGVVHVEQAGQASHLVRPKTAAQVANPGSMSDGERVVRSAADVARTQKGRSQEDEDQATPLAGP